MFFDLNTFACAAPSLSVDKAICWLSEAVTYIKAGATAVGVGRDFFQGFTPKEITERTKEILAEIRDYTEWSKK